MPEHDALVLIMARNQFYKRLHFLALGAFGLALLTIATLFAILIFLIKNPTYPVYFASDDVGRLVTVVPVNKPNMTTEEVGQWAVEAAEAAYTYDYVNYRSQMQKAEKYFTAYGWRQYMKALTASNNLIAVRERKMISIAKAVSAPELVQEGMLGDHYGWRFKIPLLVVNQLPPYDQQSRFSNPYEVILTVRRENILDSYKGLGVVQLVGKVAADIIPPQTPTISNNPAG